MAGRWVSPVFPSFPPITTCVNASAPSSPPCVPPDAKACVIAHRDELTDQNRSKFGRVNPAITTSVVDANKKSWEGQATFAIELQLDHDASVRRGGLRHLFGVHEAGQRQRQQDSEPQSLTHGHSPFSITNTTAVRPGTTNLPSLAS